MSADISEKNYYWNLFLTTCYGDRAEEIKNIVELIKANKHPKGKTYIFVGGVGSGKSTALEIICRMLYDKPDVQIVWDCRSGKHPIPYLENKIIFTSSNLMPEHNYDDIFVIETTGDRLPLSEYRTMREVLNCESNWKLIDPC